MKHCGKAVLALCLAIVPLSFACTIVEVEGPPISVTSSFKLIVTSDGHPLANSNLRIYRISAKPEMPRYLASTAQLGSDGRTEIAGLSEGKYRVASVEGDEERGIVATGAVIPNAKILVKPLGSDRHQGVAVTNAKGQFTVPVHDGKYEIGVQAKGFNGSLIPVEVSEGSRTAWGGFLITVALAECGPNPNPYRYKVRELTTADTPGLESR